MRGSTRAGESKEGVFESGAGDLEVAEGRVLEQHLAHHAFGFARGDDDSVAIALHAGDAGQSAQILDVEIGTATDLAPRTAPLDLRRCAFADDFSLVDDDD